jgi:hypothetical protein
LRTKYIKQFKGDEEKGEDATLKHLKELDMMLPIANARKAFHIDFRNKTWVLRLFTKHYFYEALYHILHFR